MNKNEKLTEATMKVLNEKVGKEPSIEEIRKKVDDALNFGVLANLYKEYNVMSGDISPDQYMLWDDLVNRMADLMLDLYEQNKD